MKTKWLCLLTMVGCLPLFAQAPASAPDTVLKWDADSKEYAAKLGEESAPFTFCVTNVSSADVSIDALRASCGCTAAQLPTIPYKLASGSNVTIKVAMDLRGKQGSITKTVFVESSAGTKPLLVRANIPSVTKLETQ
ncbi:MAG TPA: DUF1573 domain-containing protein [Verrucomicrobiae bacterium]